MNRKQTIEELKRYFSVRELVCQHTYERFGDASWQFLDTALLETLLVIRRDILRMPMVINNNIHHQRGLRCNRCDLVQLKSRVYLSAHVLGKAFDAEVLEMTAEEARRHIRENADLLPYPIRLEDDVTWLHCDVMQPYGSDAMITLFKD